MKFNIKHYLNDYNLFVPSWVSSQCFLFDTEQRAYIYNEKNFTDILLENESAILWNAIINSSSNDSGNKFDFVEFENNNLEEDIVDFIDVLISEGLIVSGDAKSNIKEPLYCVNKTEKSEREQFYAEKQEWCLKHNILESLSIELTYNCNLNCIHCYNDKSIKNCEISFDDIKPVIDDAKKLGVMSISLSGGECTLTKDFLRIAKYIREQRISLSVITNGQVFYDNPEISDEFIKLYPSRIGLSLYAMDEVIHDKITSVVGSHKKTLSVINKLCKNNVPVEIKSFQTKYNVSEYQKVKNYAEELGSSFTVDDGLLLNNNGENARIQTTEEQSYCLHKEIYKEKDIKPTVFSDKFYKQQICSAGISFLTINPKMLVKLCTSLDIIIADLNKVSLSDIWTSPLSANKNLQKWRKLKRKDLKECYKYDYCHYCTYCPGKAFRENGYLKKSDTCCRDAKIKMRIAQEQTKH